jgi:hypothetical protein
MKTKIYFSVLLFSLLATSITSTAQSGRFSVGAEAALPLGNNIYSKGSYPYGGGLSFRYEKPIGDKIGVMGTVGGQYFYSSVSAGLNLTQNSVIVVPIMFGGKYYVKDQQDGFYGSFEMGLGVSIGSSESVTFVQGQPKSSGSGTTTNFAFAPGFGYHLSRVDFGMRYQSIAGKDGSFNTWNLRIGFVFGKR